MPYPKDGNPEVTMKQELKLFPEGTTDHGFMDWGLMCHVYDEEGTNYWMDVGLAKMKAGATWGAMPFGTEEMDTWNLSCRTGEFKAATPPGQIFKVADFKGVTDAVWRPFPGGSLQIEEDKENNTAVLTLDKFTLEIDNNKKTWHVTVYDDELDVGVDITHYGEGYPYWYSKDEVYVTVDHLRSTGYNWSGRLEGTLTIKGVEHHIKGFAGRERTILPDQSNVEAGGWLDLIMFHFDEVFGGVREFKLSKVKDMGFYMRGSDKFYQTIDPKARPDECVNFTITHEDWAWLPAIGAFIPTTIDVDADVEDGHLHFTGKVCGTKCVAMQADVEVDVPNLTVECNEVTGTFTYKDGSVMELTNGQMIDNIVLWRAYPSWIPQFGGQADFVEVNPMKG